MTIYILQHTTTGTLLAYTQIGAFLARPSKPHQRTAPAMEQHLQRWLPGAVQGVGSLEVVGQDREGGAGGLIHQNNNHY
jgi:hypothetical protein